MLSKFENFALSKETMKQVTGGCGAWCKGAFSMQMNMTKAAAQAYAAACGGGWCCASC